MAAATSGAGSTAPAAPGAGVAFGPADGDPPPVGGDADGAACSVAEGDGAASSEGAVVELADGVGAGVGAVVDAWVGTGVGRAVGAAVGRVVGRAVG